LIGDAGCANFSDNKNALLRTRATAYTVPVAVLTFPFFGTSCIVKYSRKYDVLADNNDRLLTNFESCFMINSLQNVFKFNFYAK